MPRKLSNRKCLSSTARRNRKVQRNLRRLAAERALRNAAHQPEPSAFAPLATSTTIGCFGFLFWLVFFI